MVTNNVKITTKHVTGTTPVKQQVPNKIAKKALASNVFGKTSTATPINKPIEAAKKTTAIPAEKVSSRKKSINKNTVSPEERYCMIATAAYFRAEQRGFIGGYEMEDWISGEAEIDAKLNA